MRKYELMLVLPGTLDDKQVEKRSGEILDLVKESAADAELHLMGKNRLAYPIKQIRYGYFYTVVFTGEPRSVKALEDKLGLTRDILRTLITHFNTHLTASQKIAYTTDSATGITTMTERDESARAAENRERMRSLLGEEEAKEGVSQVARKIDKVDIEEIEKKLDELMSGDIIPNS